MTILLTRDDASPAEAFAALPTIIRALLVVWAQAVLRPARTKWKRSTENVRLCFKADAGRMYVTRAELEGALLAAGIKLGPDGAVYARARRLQRRRGAWPYSIALAEADDRAAFDVLLRAAARSVVPMPRSREGIRRRLLPSEVPHA